MPGEARAGGNRHGNRAVEADSAATHRGLRDSAPLLFRPQPTAGEAASFLLVQCASGRAGGWIEEATRHGVTLRRCGPAYQPVEVTQASDDFDWLAEHLLLVEIHHELTDR